MLICIHEDTNYGRGTIYFCESKAVPIDQLLNLEQPKQNIVLLSLFRSYFSNMFVNEIVYKYLGAFEQRLTVNQHGRLYYNGRPLSAITRICIVLFYISGLRPCEISRRLKVSHGVVSKMLKQ